MRPARLPHPLRPVHELRPLLAWAAVALHGAAMPAFGWPWAVALPVLALGLALAAWRGAQVRRLWRFRLRLAGSGRTLLPSHRLDRAHAALDGQLWLGWGFRWQAPHAQLCADLLKRPLREVYPPAWCLRVLGLPPRPARVRGLPWVHGLDREQDIVMPVAAMEGHTAVLAVTGALKTVLARLLVYQLARRGDTVVVLDPKGDKGLETVCRDVAGRLGRPERFLRLHLAFPADSFRLDALADADRDTEVASRLRLLVGGRSDDHFSAFAWMAVTDLVAALRWVGRRPSLRVLLDLLRSADRLEALAETALDRVFADDPAARGPRDPPAAASAAPHRAAAPRVGRARLAHLMQRFHAEVPDASRPPEVTGVLALVAADRSWFTKMTAALTPALMRLTAGDLGPLLSPDHGDEADRRPIRTTRQLVAPGNVVYLGLDALSDTSVAEGVAALVLSELAAVAGHLYNHGDTGPGRRRIHVLCDEWGDLVCEPVIQLANKGRGAGVVLYLFGQTLADLVARLGDEARAKRVLGNMNNLIVGATSDADTLDHVGRKLGETVVRRGSHSQGSGQGANDEGLSRAASRQASLSEHVQDLVPPSVLAGLPDLHYVAILDRAQVYKGRIPVLTFDTSAGGAR